MKRSFKRIFCGVLAGTCLFGLCACSQSNNKHTLPDTVVLEEPKKPDNFYMEFENYIDSNFDKKENYIISPLAFRYSMMPVAFNMDIDTQKEVLLAMGFKTIKEYQDWIIHTNRLCSGITLGNQSKEDNGIFDLTEVRSPRIYSVKNRLWENSTLNPVFFTDDYKKDMSELCGFNTFSSSASDMPSVMNQYISDNTKKQFEDFIAEDFDASQIPFYVCNTLFLKTSWKNSFIKDNNADNVFTDADGKEIKKDYIQTVGKYQYYQDKDKTFASVPLGDGLYIGFSTDRLVDAKDVIKKSCLQSVKLSFPVGDFLSDINGKVFEDYLKEREVQRIFNGECDASKVTDKEFLFSCMNQKNKVSLNEKGINTGITPVKVFSNSTDPLLATMKLNSPYYFYIYSNVDDVIDVIYLGYVGY